MEHTPNCSHLTGRMMIKLWVGYTVFRQTNVSLPSHVFIKCYKHPVTPSIRVAVCALQVEFHTSIDLLCSIVPIVITWRVSGSAGITGPTIEDTTYLSRAFVFFKQFPQKTKLSSFEQKPTKIGLHGWVVASANAQAHTASVKVHEPAEKPRGRQLSADRQFPVNNGDFTRKNGSTNMSQPPILWCFSQQTWHLLTSCCHLLPNKNGFNIASTSNALERKTTRCL